MDRRVMLVGGLGTVGILGNGCDTRTDPAHPPVGSVPPVRPPGGHPRRERRRAMVSEASGDP